MNALTDTCPPLEDIAAFLDGKLSEGERANIIAHLADCESCYAVFAGAARFQLTEEKEKEEFQEPAGAAASATAPVIPFHRRPAVRWALPLAAMLLLGLASVRLYFQYSQMPEMVSTELVDPVALKNVPLDKLWDTMRGIDSEGGLNDPAEFLIGAHLVDLRLTLERNDRESANVMSRINEQMENLLVPPTKEAAFYEKGPGQIQQGVPPRDLLDEAVRMEASLTEFLQDSAHLAFGKWTEAGRLAAIARNPELFEERKNRRFLRWLLRNADEEQIAPEVVAELEEARRLLDEDLQERRFKELEVRFGKILNHYQAEARSASPF